MKMNYEIRDTYEEALRFTDKCRRPMTILVGDGGKFWVADLFNASKLIRQGYKIANKENRETESVNVLRKSPDKYGIQKIGNRYRVVKILAEYGNEQQAINDLTQLLTGEATEQEIAQG